MKSIFFWLSTAPVRNVVSNFYTGRITNATKRIDVHTLVFSRDTKRRASLHRFVVYVFL